MSGFTGYGKTHRKGQNASGHDLSRADKAHKISARLEPLRVVDPQPAQIQGFSAACSAPAKANNNGPVNFGTFPAACRAPDERTRI